MKPKHFLGSADTHSIIWCPFFFSFFFLFLEAKQHVSLYNAQLERYHTGGLCLCCLFSLWGEGWLGIAECSSEEKHSHVQTTVQMSEAEKPCEGQSRRSTVWDCSSLTGVIEGTSQAPGAEEATGPSDLLSQPTDACYSGALVASDAGRHGWPPPRLSHSPHPPAWPLPSALPLSSVKLSPNPRVSPVSNQPGSRLHPASPPCPTVF